MKSEVSFYILGSEFFSQLLCACYLKQFKWCVEENLNAIPDYCGVFVLICPKC